MYRVLDSYRIYGRCVAADLSFFFYMSRFNSACRRGRGEARLSVQKKYRVTVGNIDWIP